MLHGSPCTLVTGASGLIGTAVVRALLAIAPEWSVRAVYWSNADRGLDDSRIEWVRADLTDLSACRRVMEGCEWAVLAAAETGGASHARRAAWEQVTPNLIIATSSLDAAHAAGVRRIVVIGSATSYQAAEAPVSEGDLDWSADPGDPHFGAGWVSRSTEKLCDFWRRAAGLDVRFIRAANVFGPRARFSQARATFLPALIRKALDAQDPYEVWGSPDVVRDVIYADDFAEAVVRLLASNSLRDWVFNVGSGRALRVGDAVTTVLRACGHTPNRVVYAGDATVGTRTRVLDCRRVFEQVAWSPRIPLDDAVRATADWWRQARDSWVR